MGSLSLYALVFIISMFTLTGLDTKILNDYDQDYGYYQGYRPSMSNK